MERRTLGTGEATFGVLCQVLGSPVQERVQQRVMKTTKGLQHLFCEERLRERTRHREWSQALLSGDQGQDKRQWAQTRTEEIPQKTLFYCGGNQIQGKVS